MARLPEPTTILITGASAGIGRITAERLARPGRRFILAARNIERLQQTADSVQAAGAQVLTVAVDVTSSAGLENLVRQATNRFGRIDVLVNNAGIECFAELESLSEEKIVSVINTNLTSAILLTRLVLPLMKQQKFGRIINMASTAGKHGPAWGAVYGATKAGLIAFTQSLRGELKRTGVSCTAICPGFAVDGGIYDEIVRSVGRRTPPLLGGTTAARVAAAVETAIHKAPPEMILNFPALRPVFVLREIWPRLGEIIIHAATLKYLRRAAQATSSGHVR
ncbi:MAG: 3-oxoacyl-[acyl-carrier-protein] reductase FabG [Planctomycetota bacterium]|jgi:short-subunit dehydrogenase